MLEKISDDSTDNDCITLDDVSVFQPGKAVFPKDDIRKGDLAGYYDSVAPLLLPHIKDRPLSLERYPQGYGSKGSTSTGLQEALPEFVIISKLKGADGSERNFLLCQNTKTLIYLTDQDHLAYYGWLSRFDKPALPDKMLIDLNPPDTTYFEEVVEAAYLLKDLLEAANMRPYVMTTGSRGLHIVCPLRRNREFAYVQAFLGGIVDQAILRRPDLVSREVIGERRGERVFLDISRNAPGKFSIIPYSVRAMDHAPVATPLGWDELSSSDLHPQRYTVTTIGKRLAQKGDVWENFFRHKRKLMR